MKVKNLVTWGGISLGALGVGLAIKSFLPQRFETTSFTGEKGSVQRSDSAALPALEKEAAAVQDLETRYRIQALLKSIPRREALAKVFGATKRVTYSAREAPLLRGSGHGWNARGMHTLDPHPVSAGRWTAAVDGYRRGFVAARARASGGAE